MLHKTKGIVTRAVKFGETSLVLSVYTELFGMQSYIVNGIRQASKKGGSKSGYFQPGALLDLVVYKNEFAGLQRIREYRWAHIFQRLFSDIFKNAVVLYMVEVLQKSGKEPEPNADLFLFIEDCFLHLDEAPPAVTANFPLFFALHAAHFFGFRILNFRSDQLSLLDLQEGLFVAEVPAHRQYLADEDAAAVDHILRISQPADLAELRLNVEQRRRLLNSLETYYALHVPEFGTLRTLPVLREISS